MGMKKLRLPAALAMSLLMAFGIAASPVAAASAPKIDDVDYEGKGKVEVEFKGKVRYSNSSVTVKDASGKAYTAKITDRDSDDITFRIKNYKTATTYHFTIHGIKKRGASSYSSVSGKVRIPAAGKVKVKDIEYDADDQQVEFEFKGKIKWAKPVVTITDANGTNYALGIADRDSDSIEVDVDALTEGATYTYKITGLKNRESGDAQTLTGSFEAWDDDDDDDDD